MLILTGIAGNNCVLFTANDAYLRDFRLWVPGDCIASNTEEDNRYALAHMRSVLKADVRPSDELDLGTLKEELGRGESRSLQESASGQCKSVTVLPVRSGQGCRAESPGVRVGGRIRFPGRKRAGLKDG
jgi:hypothetical protein